MDYIIHKPGLDVGFGISMQVKWNVKMYAEAKYVRVFAGSLGHMDYLPISIGFRF